MISICDDCGVEGIATVWYEDSEGNDIDASNVDVDELRRNGEAEKWVAYECPECFKYWEHHVE